jgi:hypothetical protein
MSDVALPAAHVKVLLADAGVAALRFRRSL